jgi:hypothetical protein
MIENYLLMAYNVTIANYIINSVNTLFLKIYITISVWSSETREGGVDVK